MSEIDLGDKRLNKRSGTLLAIDTANPSASIPVACGGRAETIFTCRRTQDGKGAISSRNCAAYACAYPTGNAGGSKSRRCWPAKSIRRLARRHWHGG
ncbi:transposase DNA-binding-containing protein [Methylosarcina fibrata]|uniref:transposase DNA-binding-containing protein n=1 Tax=Methylosarcina fibrata TaxID=105972 RepID=UPI0009FFD1B8